MIQCALVRGIALIMLLVAGSAAAATANEAGMVAIYWQPPGAPAVGVTARAAFSDAVRPLGARVLDATPPPIASAPSLAPILEAAKADYGRFKFSDALARLDDLQRSADAQGGGNLDNRQLSEIFLYRGLCRLETGADEAAWDDLIRAARLDPERVMDPARFPPRAAATYRRAVAEAAQLPRARFEVDAPRDATVRIDGSVVNGSASLTLGQHFVSVAADGFEPWAAVVPVAGGHQHFTPPLHAYLPPDGDQLLALAGAQPPNQLLLGALERTATGWRFVARDVTLSDGKFVSDAVPLGDVPLKVAVAALVKRVLPADNVALVAPAPAAKSRPRRWPWIAGAGGVVLIAAGITLGVVLGTSSSSGTISGTLGIKQ